MGKAEVYAKHKMARISPKKVGIVIDMIKDRSLHDAKLLLTFDHTKAAKMVLKVLKSAESNAKNNYNLDPEKLYLSEVYANQARTYKFGRMGSKGRFDPILKRNSHIVIGLSSTKVEPVESKGRIRKVTKKK